MKRRVGSNRKAKELLGWEASIGLDEGLRDTVEWIRGQRMRAPRHRLYRVRRAAPHSSSRPAARGLRGRSRPCARDAGEQACSPLSHDLTTCAGSNFPRSTRSCTWRRQTFPFPTGPFDLERVNTAATVALLDHARRCGAKRFVLTSSASVYGFGDRPWREEDDPAATDFYSATKLAAERYVSTFQGFFETSILRLVAPYGPGQRNRMIPRLIESVRDGRTITLNEGSKPVMNPIYIDDVVRVVDSAIMSTGNHLVNVAGDEALSIEEIGVAIGHAIERDPIFEHGSGAAPRGHRMRQHAHARDLLHRLSRHHRRRESPHRRISWRRIDVRYRRNRRFRRATRRSSSELQAMVAAINHRGPDDKGVWANHHVGLGECAARDYRSLVGGPPAHDQRGRSVVLVATTASSTTFASSQRSSRTAATYSVPGATRRSSFTPMRSGARLRAALQRDVCVRGLGRAHERAAARPRQFGVKPLYCAVHDGRLLFGSEIKVCSPWGTRGVSSPGAWWSTSRSRTCSPT